MLADILNVSCFVLCGPIITMSVHKYITTRLVDWSIQTNIQATFMQ
jgi:hypothetical protein